MRRVTRGTILCCCGLVAAFTGLAVFHPSRQWNVEGVGVLSAVPSAVSVRRSDQGDNTKLVEVELINQSEFAVTIVDVRTSSACPCAIARPLSRTSLAPGERTTLHLKLTPPRHGRQDQVVYVRTNSSTHGTLTIPVRLEGVALAPPLIMHQPAEVELVGHTPGEVVSRSITLTATERADDEPWIVGLKCHSGKIEAGLESPPVTNPLADGLVVRSYSFGLIGTTPLESEGPKTVDRLHIVTRVEPANDLRDIVVSTLYQPRVRAVPEEISIQVSEGAGFPIERTMLVVGEVEDNWSVSVDTELPPWLDVQPDSDGEGIARTLRLQVRDGCLREPSLQKDGRLDLNLSLKTTLADAPVVTATIRLRCRR